MEEFRQIINGVDFTFLPIQKTSEIVYQADAEGHAFLMKLSKSGAWKIQGKVPFWIKELEGNISDAIEKATR